MNGTHFVNSRAYLEFCLAHLYSQLSVLYTNKGCTEANIGGGVFLLNSQKFKKKNNQFNLFLVFLQSLCSWE